MNMRRPDLLSCAAIGFSLGVSLGVFFPGYAFDGMVVTTLVGTAYGFSFFGRPFFVSVGLLLLSVIFGLFYGSQEFRYWDRMQEPLVTFQGLIVVMSPSVEKSFFRETEVRVEECQGSFCPQERVLLRESNGAVREVGERLDLVCDLKRPEEYIEIAGRQVAYRMILASRGIGYVCEKPSSVQLAGQLDGTLVLFQQKLASLREGLIVSLERSLPAPEAALSLGMLIGADEGFSSVEKEIFIRAGVTHVTAVSGYNITLASGLLFFLAIFLGWYRQSASAFALMGIALYVLLVGAPASAVRAGIMGSLLLLSLGLGRPGSAFRIWLLALAGMLIWNPLLIRYDIGFELSFLATLALLLYAGVRNMMWVPKSGVARFFYELLMLSLFVEWLAMPVMLLQFGTFSLVSLPANVFLVPLVPIIMLFAFLSGVTGLVVSGGLFFITWPAYFFAHAFISGAEFLSGLPYSFLTELSVSLGWALLWYTVTGFFFWFFLWRKRNAVE